ncbi:FitA-like ribbon-helix-helix domain-containing protein [Geodermatophilus maliterrae]|uniref:Antitoxin FitA-like ribbon-helix-helix domain-containing protein n=1 Tax=Geodermatophilus maliterrae TaxID=3162531 RepID=A0ABV3XDC9_9ACTN
MPVSMTIPDVRDDTHDELAARAARAGLSLQEYVRGRLIELARRSNPVDLWDRVEHRMRVTGSRVEAEEILELRDTDHR